LQALSAVNDYGMEFVTSKARLQTLGLWREPGQGAIDGN
jgi:hypothetical protein